MRGEDQENCRGKQKYDTTQAKYRKNDLNVKKGNGIKHQENIKRSIEMYYQYYTIYIVLYEQKQQPTRKPKDRSRRIVNVNSEEIPEVTEEETLATKSMKE